jgi:hypothetical protein
MILTGIGCYLEGARKYFIEEIVYNWVGVDASNGYRNLLKYTKAVPQ